jgi:hypothetical protein
VTDVFPKADPITPIKTALRLNKQMHDSSTLLIQNGPGVSLS